MKLLLFGNLISRKMIGWIGRGFVVIYALLKNLLPFRRDDKNRFLSAMRQLLIILLTLTIGAIGILCMLPFILFSTCLDIGLRIVYRSSYGGLLTGNDLIFELNEDQTLINAVVIYSSSKDELKLVGALREAVRKLYNSATRMTCSIRKFCGYRYFVENKLNPDDILEFIKLKDIRYITKEILFDYLEKNCSTLKQSWKVRAFLQPIHWNESSEQINEQYVLLLTFRHSLGDGLSVISAFTKILLKKVVGEEMKSDTPKAKSKINLNNVYVYRNMLTTRIEPAALKMPNSSNWHVAAYTDSQIKCIPMIKQLKQTLNVTFTAILEAACFSSVADYVKLRQVQMSKITLATLTPISTEDVLKVKNSAYDLSSMRNNSSLLTKEIPYELSERSMTQKILTLHEEGDKVRRSIDAFIAYTCLSDYASYLPICLTKFFSGILMNGITIEITNLLGPDKGSFDGGNVDDAFFFVPNFMKVGFFFSVLSYDDRLQISVASRKGFVHSREELQAILDNALKYIDQAMMEITPFEHL